jgi:iron complex outermembrane receptor protein
MKLFTQTSFALAVSSLLQGMASAQVLPDVVISASRSEQRSFDAPAAIQSIDRATIESAGPQVNLSESLNRVPGLTILDRQNYAQDLQVSIRGFGARSAFGIRGIRLLIDGIPATTPDGQGQGSSISLTSTDHIEVLRGPLAQLYGNSSGGVIQAFTKDAPKDAEAGFKYYLGSDGMRRADYQYAGTAGIYGLLADYSTFSTDGYRDNSATQRKQFNGKLGFAPNEQTKVNVVFNQFDMPLARDPLGLTSAQMAANPLQAGTNSLGTKTAADYLVRKTVLQSQLGSSATYAIDSNRSVTGRIYYGTRDNLQYQVGAAAGPNVNGAWTGLERKYYGAGLLYNAKTKWGETPVEWATGYEFDRSREFRQGGAANLGEKATTARSEDNQSENSDLFVQGTAHVTDRVSIVSGVRYSTVRFSSDDYYLADGHDGSGNTSYRSTNPVLGFTYHASQNVNLYANYGKGFETPTLAEMAYRDGGTSAIAEFNPGLNAATSRHYEAGAKWVPNRQSRLDFALFQINSTDEIVVATSSNGQTAYKNAPGTTRTGWELAGNTLLSPNVSATLSASMINAQYSQSFKTGTTSVAAASKLPGIPQTFLFSELAWTSQPATEGRKTSAMGTRLGIELVQAGRIYANDTNTASADGHTVVNLSASHGWSIGKGSLVLYGRLNNVTDKFYVGSVIVNQASSQYYEPGLTRNWIAGLNLSCPI